MKSPHQYNRVSTPLAPIAALLAIVALPISQSALAATDTFIGVTPTFTAGFNNLPQNGDTLIFGPTGASAVSDDITSLTLGGSNTDGIDFLATASAYTITIPASGTQTLTLASSGTGIGINDLSRNAETITVPITLASTQVINVATKQSLLTLGGVVAGTGFGLTKTGSGLLTLSGANTYTGPIAINGGTLAVSADGTGAAQQLGAGGVGAGSITLNGGALRVTAATTLSANRGIILGGGGGTFDQSGNNQTTFNGVISGGANNFVKTGQGTLALGGANTYTGTTSVNQGTLRLDFSQTGAPASNIINPGSALVLGGVASGLSSATSTTGAPASVLATTTLNVLSASAGNSAQTFNGTTIDRGMSVISTTQTLAGNVLLNLGALTRNPGGLVNFSLAGAMSANNAIRTTTANDASGILGGWAAIGGTAYAANDGAGNIVAYTGYTALPAGAITGTTSTTNGRIQTAATTITAAAATTTDLNTISTAPAATGLNVVTIGAGGVLRLGANGGVMISTGGGNLTFTGGTLTAGGAANTTGQINVMSFASGTLGSGPAQNNGAVNISSVIADNGTGAVSLVIGNDRAPSNNNLVNLYNAGNSYSGGTIVSNGRLISNINTVGANNASFGTGSVTVQQAGQVFLGGQGIYANNFFIAGAAGPDSYGAIRMAGNTTLAGQITLLADAGISLRNSVNNVITGQITGGFNLSLAQITGGVGNVTLSNTANNYTGNLTIAGERVILGASEVLSNGNGVGNVILNDNAAILDLNGSTETINGLVSTGATTPTVQNGLVASASTLTLGDGNATSTYGGTIRDNGGAGGTVALTKIGNALQVLSGTVNAYSGDTNINGGVLHVTATAGLNAAGNVLINATATGAGELRSATSAGNVTLSANNGANAAHLNPGDGLIGGGSVGTLNLSSLTMNGGVLDFDLTTPSGTNDLLAVTGAVNFAAASTISLYGPVTTGTYTLINAGSSITYTVNPTFNVQTVGRPASVALNTINTNSLRIDVVSGAAILKWTGAGNGNWDNQISANNWLNTFSNAPDKFYANDKVTFDDTATNYNVTLVGSLAPASLNINNSSHNYTFAGSGIISGTTTLTKDGTGQLTINTANTYSGGTVINGGTVQLNDGAALGSGTIANDGILTLNHTVNATFANAVEGSGQLVKTGAGATTISGPNSYLGNTAINQGALSVTGSLANSGTVNVNAQAGGAGELRGTGSVGNVVLSANSGANTATLSPGAGGVNSIGTLTANSLTVNGGNMIFDLTTPTGTNDLLITLGGVNFAAASTLTLNPTVPILTGNYLLMTANGGLTYGVAPTIVQAPSAFRPAALTLNTSNPNQLSVDAVSGALALTWTGSVNSNWDVNTTANWKDPSAAPQKFFSGDNVTFDDSASNHTVTLASVIFPGSVTVNSTADYVFNGVGSIDGAITLTKSGSSKLTINNANTYSGGTTINAGIIQLNDAGTLGTGPIMNDASIAVNNSAIALTLGGLISGTGSITKTGTGVFTANNADSTYSGGTTITAGTVFVGQNSSGTVGAVTSGPLGTGTITLNGGTLNTNGKTIFNNLFAVANTSSTVDAALGNAILDGNLSGSGTVTFRNTTVNNLSFTPGTNNAIDWSGFTGRLIHMQGGIGTGIDNFLFRAPNSTVDLSNATVELQSAASNTNITFAADAIGQTLKIGALTGSSGNLSNAMANALVQVGFLNTNTTFGGVLLNFNAASAFEKVGTGTLTLTGVNSLAIGAAQAGTFIVSQGTLTGTGASPLGAAGGALVVRNTNTTGPGTNTVLNLSTTAPTSKGSLSGLIATPTSGTNTVTINNGGQLFTITQTVDDVFQGVIAGSGGFTKAGANTLTLDGMNTYTGATTITAGTLQLGDGTSGHDGTIAATSGITNNGTLIYNRFGNLSSDRVISGTGAVTKLGSGTQTLTGVNTYTGATSVNEGKLILGQSLTKSSALNIATGAVAQLALGTNKVIVTSALSLAGTGTLDLTNNWMVVHGGNLAAISGLITSGAHDLAFDGPGITSSRAAAAGNTALGFINNADFGYGALSELGFTGTDVTLAPTDVIVRYTYFGDADLNGVVNADDVTLLGIGFSPGSSPTWGSGDFDYNGVVNADDVTLLGINFGATAPPSLVGEGGGKGGTQALAFANTAPVPEPSIAGFLALGAAGLVSRRRRAKG